MNAGLEPHLVDRFPRHEREDPVRTGKDLDGGGELVGRGVDDGDRLSQNRTKGQSLGNVDTSEQDG